MDLKQRATRRSLFGKGIAAALVLGGLAVPASSLAKGLDDQYYMKVFYDKNGKAVKVCYYDQNFNLLYCTSASMPPVKL